MKSSKFSKAFAKFANAIAKATGHPATFTSALAIILLWAISGPIFGFSDTWQLVINTGTTIITFLMVFLIQNTQNRDSEAIHLKLDELILAIESADNKMVDIEGLGADELQEMHERYKALADKACKAIKAKKTSSEHSEEEESHDAAA